MDYSTAILRYKKAGSLKRDNTDVTYIYYNICKPCSYFKNNVCSHDNWGYPISEGSNPLGNKIVMTTESCPIGKWGHIHYASFACKPTTTPPILKPLPSANITPLASQQIQGLSPNPKIVSINGSLILYKNQWIMVYRYGWNSAKLRIAYLDRNFNVTGHCHLEVPRVSQNRYGQEDPRVWVHLGRVYVAYIGVQPEGQDVTTHQFYCEIDPFTGKILGHYTPQYVLRDYWEKNWSFFGHGEQLYAVYSISPHIIIKINGSKAAYFHETPWQADRPNQAYRGGACPVQVDNEFYCFYHHLTHIYPQRKVYSLGLYTFSASPPFSPRRFINGTILAPRQEDHPGNLHPYVVYPCGAVLHNERWYISYGYYDHQVWIAQFGFDQLNQKLQPISHYRDR